MTPKGREDLIGAVVILAIGLALIFGIRHSVRRTMTPEIACQRFCQVLLPSFPTSAVVGPISCDCLVKGP